MRADSNEQSALGRLARDDRGPRFAALLKEASQSDIKPAGVLLFFTVTVETVCFENRTDVTFEGKFGLSSIGN